MKWKKVNQEVPAKSGKVLVLINNEIPLVVKFVKDINMFCDDELEVKDVTHWLPIPRLKQNEKLDLRETLNSAF